MGELHRGEGLRELANAPKTQGSFTFDPDELRALIKKWQNLADSYADSVSQADRMSRIKPPGNDFASEAHARAANGSGASYISYLEANARYCTEQANLFQSALNDYLGVEDSNAAEFDKSDRGA